MRQGRTPWWVGRFGLSILGCRAIVGLIHGRNWKLERGVLLLLGWASVIVGIIPFFS